MMQPAGMGLVFQHVISVQQYWIYGETYNSCMFYQSAKCLQRGISYISWRWIPLTMYLKADYRSELW